MQREGRTYHDGHTSALDDGAEYQYSHYYAPALHPSLHATGHDDNKADQRAQLNDHAEAHQEPNGAPHVAERGIFVAVGGAREGDAVPCFRRAAGVQAVGVVSLAVLVRTLVMQGSAGGQTAYRTIRHPSWHGDAGDCHRGADQREQQAHGVYAPARHDGAEWWFLGDGEGRLFLRGRWEDRCAWLLCSYVGNTRCCVRGAVIACAEVTQAGNATGGARTGDYNPRGSWTACRKSAGYRAEARSCMLGAICRRFGGGAWKSLSIGTTES